jgi:hypothetical protein
MGKQRIAVVDAGFQGWILFAADAAVGHPLVAFALAVPVIAVKGRR